MQQMAEDEVGRGFCVNQGFVAMSSKVTSQLYAMPALDTRRDSGLSASLV